MSAETAPQRGAPEPPSGLKDAGLRLWTSIIPAYTLRPDELRILEDACHECDVIARLQDELDISSLVTEGSMGQEVAHPTVSEVRQHRQTLRALLAQLKLPDTPSAGPSSGGRAQVSEQARAAARARWGSRAGA